MSWGDFTISVSRGGLYNVGESGGLCDFGEPGGLYDFDEPGGTLRFW